LNYEELSKKRLSSLYFNAMILVGMSEEAYARLEGELERALHHQVHWGDLLEIGKIYYQLGKQEEFQTHIEKYPDARTVLHFLEMRSVQD